MPSTLLALVLSATPLLAEQRPSRPDVCPRDIASAFALIEDSHVRLGREIDREPDGRRRRVLQKELEEARSATARARERACRAAQPERPDRPTVIVTRPPPPPPPPPRSLPMDAATHASVLQRMKDEIRDGQREAILQLALGRDGCVSSAQAAAFVQVFSFSAGRAAGLAALAPRLIPDGQAHIVLDAFTFISEKEAATATLRSASPIEACAYP
jgi:hypothetical protein